MSGFDDAVRWGPGGMPHDYEPESPREHALARLERSPLRKARRERIRAEVLRRIAAAELAFEIDRRERALEVQE